MIGYKKHVQPRRIAIAPLQYLLAFVVQTFLFTPPGYLLQMPLKLTIQRISLVSVRRTSESRCHKKDSQYDPDHKRRQMLAHGVLCLFSFAEHPASLVCHCLPEPARLRGSSMWVHRLGVA